MEKRRVGWEAGGAGLGFFEGNEVVGSVVRGVVSGGFGVFSFGAVGRCPDVKDFNDSVRCACGREPWSLHRMRGSWREGAGRIVG